MGTLKRVGIALIVGAVLVGVAGIVALATGNDARFFQGCVMIALVCVAAALVMSGTLFVGSTYPSRAARRRPATSSASGLSPASIRLSSCTPNRPAAKSTTAAARATRSRA
jgi:CBS domain containing-hemolysin-like protein